jgi:hypothetical protein
MTSDQLPEATRESRTHRGHRIVAVQLGAGRVGTIYAPGSNAIMGNVEGASVPEVMIRGVDLVNGLLAAEPR